MRSRHLLMSTAHCMLLCCVVSCRVVSCRVASILLQAWTFNDRAAIVIGVTEQSAAVQDRTKLQRLQQLLTRLVEKTGDNVAVSVEQVG